MDFYWDFNSEDWDKIINIDKTNENYIVENLVDWTIGNCRIGDLCFDLVIRDYDSRLYLTYDLYVGGIDSGYGYGKDGYPYDYADGEGWSMESIKAYTFDEFKNMAEDEFRAFIKISGCEDKANGPLHIW